MSLFVPSSPAEDLPLTFSATTSHVSHLADVFSAVTAISPHALLIVSNKGLVVYAEHNHICNIQLTVDPSLFSSFSFTGPENDDLRLAVDVSLVSNALAAAIPPSVKFKSGPSTAVADAVKCYISYGGEGHPLVLEFEDALMSERIEFLTFYSEITYPYDPMEDDSNDNYNLIVSHNEIQAEVILKSDVFSNLLLDLQQINTADLYICISNKTRYLGGDKRSNVSFVDNQLNFISRGPIGLLKLIYPTEKSILEKLNVYEKQVDSEYEGMQPTNASIVSSFNFLTFIKIFRAVKLSTKCKIMKDLSGVLSLQLICKNARLTSYPGTLITFNLLEVISSTNEFDTEESTAQDKLGLGSIFDDDSYEYIKEYNSRGKGTSLPATGQEYESLEALASAGPDPAPIQPLLYASFKTNKRTNADLQVNTTVYEQETQKRRDTAEDDVEFETVGGAIEIPLFF